MNNAIIKNGVLTGLLGTMYPGPSYDGDTSDYLRIQTAAAAFATTVDAAIPPDVSITTADGDLIRGFCKNDIVARVIFENADPTETQMAADMLVLMYNGMKGLLS